MSNGKRFIERRLTPRVRLLGQLKGRLVALDLPVVVLDISVGGARMQTPCEIVVGTAHDVSLRFGHESTVYLRGVAVRCLKANLDSDVQWYETAFRFLDRAEAEAGVAGLLEHLETSPRPD